MASRKSGDPYFCLWKAVLIFFQDLEVKLASEVHRNQIYIVLIFSINCKLSEWPLSDVLYPCKPRGESVSTLLKSGRSTTTKYILEICHVILETDLFYIAAYRYKHYLASDHFNAYIFCRMCLCWDHRAHRKWPGQVCHEPLHKVWVCYSFGFHHLVCSFPIFYLELLVPGFPMKSTQKRDSTKEKKVLLYLYKTCFLSSQTLGIL